MDHSPLQRSPFAGSPFSGIFLAWCVAAVVLSIFFFSYFHRALASLLSLAIRSYTWKAHGIYIDLRALQVSLLGGRIFFTGLRYHGNNETIFIQNGYITWSYWQWRVRQSDIDRSKVAAQDQAAGKDDKNARLPCRVNVVLNGLEWFVYNRSAAYDSVLAGIVQDTETPLTPVPKEEEHAKLRRRADRAPYGSPGDTSPRKSISQRGNSGDNSSWNGHGRPKMTFQTAGSDEDNAASQGKSDSDDELPLLLQFFPIHLRCTKAAVVMGNENTKAIMIINSKGLTGEIDASATETQDPYRQTYKIKLESPVIEFRDNQDYKEDQVDKAVREREAAKQSAPLQRRSIFRRYRRKALSRMRDLVPFWRSTVESLSLEGEDAPVAAAERKPPGSNHWQGLSRYLDDLERNEQLRWAGVEYAAENTILDTPEATITMYWDTPGLVAPRRPGTVEKATAPENVDNINGDDPPAWGINVSIKGGSINYGPWADRHRAELQRVFFPGLCKDSQPAQRLPVGASRVPTQLKVYVELDDDVTLRVPIREESKNWRFRGKEPPIRTDKERDRRRTRNRLKQSDQGTAGAFDRQYGWLDVKLAANATVSYCMDMAAGNHGFSSSLDLDFPKTEITSSINHELLWRSGKQRISCDLSTPLKWNALRQWRFDITTDALELFILRDHVFLLTDLINDWSSGPPAEYLVFTPFKYFIDLHFPNVKLYLNVNDGNIINKPTDPEDNAYIIITSPLLEASTCISLDKFRPAKSMIPFDVRTDEASIDLHVPPWNTQASFVKSMAIGHLETLVIDGGYHYNAATAPALTDTLILNVNGQSPVVHLYGFVIRYFLKVKDNYFGDDVHFKTLEEYQEMLELTEKNPEAEAQTKPPPKKSNGMDVILSVRVDDPKIFLPANLYSSERNVQIDGTILTADMRFTNYYMDLDLVLSPLHLSLAHGDNGADTPISATTTTQLFIDGISVYGHRVFGLPPTEPTYLCNWDLSVGAVSGECTAEFLTALMRGGKAFGLSFDDDENALISNASIVMYDVTFLRVIVQSVRLWLHVDEAAFLFSTGSIDVSYNDWARSHYSKRSNITIPDIQLSCVNAESASRQRSRSHDAVETDLMVRTSVHLATIARKFDFSNQRQAQQELVRLQPDTTETLVSSIEDDETGSSHTEFDLGDVDPANMAEDHAYSSIMIELPTGLTAFMNPTALKNVAALISALQPSDPEDILDTLQVNAMSSISAKQNMQKMKGTFSDLHLRIPRANLRFVNASEMDSSEPPKEEQDQYDFHIGDLAFMTRSHTSWKDPFDASSMQKKDSFHVRLGNLEVAAAERLASHYDTHAAAKAQIENVMVSMGSKDLTYLDGDVGSIRSSLSSEKIEYLASLIHRTTALATDLESVFSPTLAREAKLTRYLAYKIVTQAHDAIDPTFLIRPSAVLRSAKQHLRTYDSWKLIARLRQMWATLNPSSKDQLRLDCYGSTFDYPADARQYVVNAFERWRSWDLHDTQHADLITDVFGKNANDQPAMPSTDLAFLAVIRLRDTQIVLDPGPKQNEISFTDITARFQDKNPPGPYGSPEFGSEAASMTTLNVYCGEAAIRLNWDLCELVEDALRLYMRLQDRKEDRPPAQEKPSTKALGNSLHVIVAVGHGEVALDAINLNSVTLVSGLKASLLVRNDSKDVSDTDFILSCEAVTSRMRSHTQVLGVFQLREPAVVASHTLHKTQTTDSHTIKASANSKQLSLAVQQDPLGLLEVLDLLIKDEAAQLNRLKSHLPSSVSSPKPKKPDVRIKDRLSSFRVNIAMFLDEYNISVPLLQSLTYCISGVVARAAMAANFGKEIIFDFDIKENCHEIQVKVNEKLRSLSLLQIPPINGRIKSIMGQEETKMHTFASVELIQLDASAVYSLLGALNKPEISSTINEIQEQVRMIQGQIRETFGIQSRSPSPRESTPVKPPKPAVAYLVHVTFEGVEIFGNSPLKSKKEPLAYILFRLAGVHLRMTNCPETHRQILEYPEVHINLRQIEWEIARISDAGVRTCGRVAFGALVTATSKMADDGAEQRYFDVATDGFEVILSPETVSTAVDVLGYMGDKIKDLDTSRELELLRKLRQTRPKIIVNDEQEEQEEPDFLDSWLSSIRYNFEIRKMQISWLVLRASEEPAQGKEDLVFTWDKIELGTRTRNSARLTVENFQVQTVPTNQDKRLRSANSALLPEVVFNVAYVSTSNARRMAFQAVGKALDLRLTSGFVIPVSNVIDSINLSVKNVRQASQHWNPPRRPSQLATPSDKPTEPRKALFGNKRMESFLVDADFAGAVVYLVGKKEAEESARTSRATRAGLAGKYGQFSADDNSTSTVMKSPGIAFKVEYRDPGTEDPSLYGEIMIDASSNTLYPSFVPLVMDMTSSIKEVVADTSDKPDEQQQTLAKTKTAQDDYLLDPSAVIGRLKLNLGLRICRQEFTLSCQPIARVAATAAFDDVYFTVNTVASADQGKFFAISGAITNLHASVRHVYSREETGQFNVDSIVLSLMNSKHVSGTSGASAILKFSPMEVSINAKQLQDFLLFREIWIPRDVRQASTNPMAKLQTETSQGHLVQRYQQVAATAAFPWTATVSMEALTINVDLGQAIGKSKFAITDFWVSSKKTSDWEQNLCLGFHRIGVDSQGRMSGFVAMQDFKLRTAIQWPQREQALNDTPMIQASVKFSKLQIKAAFDYQAFLVADIKSMDFLMYNVRRPQGGAGDRLVATFEGDAVQVFGTTTSAAQGIALYQAFMKLVAERKASFETSLKEIEKFMRRSSTASTTTLVQRPSIPKARDDGVLARAPISLDTDVVVTFKALNLGIFPTTFSDHQVFKMEALNAQARFAASIDDRRVHSILGLTLGQLRIGLAGVRTVEAPKALSELAVEDVVQSATGSRGGTILKVPRVEATMQTWQQPDSRHIDYIFKSAFEGKVEVGWNYSRISSIRDMWANHTKTLALAYGREVAITSAIKVTGVLPEPGSVDERRMKRREEVEVEVGKEQKREDGEKKKDQQQQQQQQKQQQQQQQQGKITAEVDLPQSKYEYNALEPPIIETPQLRDMGEATPPLEWIGLHRDRLPNLTHQIVIVSLLELAGEVEDAYSRILGSS
ncbi:Protein CSF1 [Cytospora mali]|uniref:Protein CSF1 n=1 Tax=Cytospora mali TaxID=578113 RepID=A0A194UTQ6_CYTMA|nr:Protein CSF1 [Valsa mali var. pyri (nom. inval.)]